VHTPGHSDDHICLFEPQKTWLFSGDLYTSEKPIVARPEERQWHIIASLKKVRALKPRIMFPAPGKVVTEASGVLDRTIVYLESLGKRVLKLHEKGLSPIEIRDLILGQEATTPLFMHGSHREQKLTFSDFTDEQFSTKNLIRSFLKE
jgi:glyoxylase-like metal-dependent hydrolase (beta-lactamase superfamily II)